MILSTNLGKRISITTGKKVYTDGIYEGDFVNHKRHGQGKMISVVGEYEGNWKDDKHNGQGKRISVDGVYEGEWKDDKRHGQGEMYYKNGDYSYKGTFYNNFIGEGEYSYPDGNKIKYRNTIIQKT